MTAGNVWAEEIARLVRHTEYSRQINSNRAFRLERFNRWLTVATVLVAAAITFIGFAGIDTLAAQLREPLGWSDRAVELGYNAIILLVLLMTIIGLIYKFPERAAAHNQAVRDTTDFIRIYEDIVRLDRSGAQAATKVDEQKAQSDYRALIGKLPPSTDKEFARAKEDYRRKRLPAEAKVSPRFLRLRSHIRGLAFVNRNRDERRLVKAVSRSPVARDVLEILRSWPGQEELWLAGSLVRGATWDALFDVAIPTPVDDVDIFYFDKEDASKAREHAIEAWLGRVAPNINWDVKNEARFLNMSGGNFASLEEALRHSPDTASAVAIRRVGRQVHILAPLGVRDLLEGVVRRAAAGNGQKFEERRLNKRWSDIWPGLNVRTTDLLDQASHAVRPSTGPDEQQSVQGAIVNDNPTAS